MATRRMGRNTHAYCAGRWRRDCGILTLLQWLRHHVDFVAILSVLIVGILMLIIATVLTERPSPAAKKIPQGHPMPVCTIQTTEEWTRVGGSLEHVVNQKFVHQEVLLDGRAFTDCSFTHVSLYYDGTAPMGLINCEFDEDTKKHFHSHNPAMATWIELLRCLGSRRWPRAYLPNCVPGRESSTARSCA
jgi:hypothetical protein